MKHIPISTAEELLAYLAPFNPAWEERYTADTFVQAPWIFRGQRKSDWDLVPSALRPNAFSDFFPGWDNSKSFASGDLIEYTSMAEVFSVYTFLRIADSLGLHTPIAHDTNLLLNAFVADVNRAVTNHTPLAHEFPPHGLKEAFALAQHHGIPTRFLDWTYNSYFAAFFAAHDAYLHKNEWSDDDKIAIWAVNFMDLEFDDTGNSLVQMLYPPYASNSFLRSQAGLFTYLTEANDFARNNQRWPTINEVIDGELGVGKENMFVKITLPVSQVHDLLDSLYKIRVSKANLMPTLDNVKSNMTLKTSLMKTHTNNA